MSTRSVILRLAAASGVTVAILTGAATAAQAQKAPVTVYAPADIHTARVGYADLNLADEVGQSILKARVSEAASKVCGVFLYQPRLSIEDRSTCVAGAVAGARPQVARAMERARQIAANGFTTLPAVAIRVSA